MIAKIRSRGFLTDDEISQFSDETQDKVKTLPETPTR